MKKRSFIILFMFLLLTLLFSCQNTAPESGDTKTEQEEYTVTFDTGCDYYVKPKVVKSGESFNVPYDIPMREGYVFKAWYLGEREWIFGKDKVTADMTLSARYDLVNYSISYELFGGISNEILVDKYNIESGVITLPSLTHDSSYFRGWYLNGERITEISSSMKGDVTLVAKYYDSIPAILDQALPADAAVYATSGEKSVTVELSTESGESKDFRLSVEVPDSWHFVRASQGNDVSYVTARTENGKKTAHVNMSSDGFDLTLSALTLTDDLMLDSAYGTTLENGHKIDTNYFPGFVRKTVSFSLDDGLVYDENVISILKPAGIRGTFNLCGTSRLSAEEYRSLYEGYEVANHHILHTTAWRDDFDYSKINFADGYLPSAESDRDPSLIYKNGMTVDGRHIDGFYYIHYSMYGSTAGWHPLATNETYMEYLRLTEEKIEKVFGEGSVVGFIFPHGSLTDSIKELIKESGYLYARKTGNLRDSTGFALPKDRFAWTYNADHNCLLEVMAKFDSYADDGELKMFSFGVHAKDFETYGKWEDLRRFAELYGNRPEDFWYATNREIFEYEDAVNALVITSESIFNPSDIDVFITVDGIKTLIPRGTEYIFES